MLKNFILKYILKKIEGYRMRGTLKLGKMGMFEEISDFHKDINLSIKIIKNTIDEV